jgi:predicted nucleic acid-binding protein
MPRLFALDSSIVVILAGGASDEPRARERAESLLLEHEDAGEHVGVPAAGWAECCHCDVQKSSSFMIWPLNAAAATLANRLTPPMIEAGKAKGSSKREVKIDALILATAETAGCTGLYTTDEWFATVAQREGLRVQIRPLPPVRPVQVELPDVEPVHLDPSEKPNDS